MLPPVNAPISTQPLAAPAIGQREARPDAPAAVGQAQSAIPPSAVTATQQGAASETLASLRQLADLLASRQVDAEDILTQLAIDFATSLGEAPMPDEPPRDFARRLADLIRQLPAATLLAARDASHLGALKIEPQAFAAALADPASPAAARLVAIAEDPGADGLQQMLKNAIDSYEQNATPAPNVIAAQKAAAMTGASTAKSPDAPANAEADAAPEKAGDAASETEAAVAPARPAQARALTPDAAAALRASASPAAGKLETPALPGSAAPADGHAALTDHEAGQPTMQVLRGFNVVVANVATRAADVLKTVAALAQQAEAAQTFAPAGAAVAGQAQKPVLTATPVEPELVHDPAPVIAGKAHEAARALEGKVIPLFSRPATSEHVETIDIDHLIRLAQQTAAKADPARFPELALAAQARLPEPVPFAQIPYPFVAEDEEKRNRRGFGEQAGRDEDGEEMTDENGQSLWHGDGDQAERREEPEIEERPFDAEEPLKRNPTDAERALHMYQRFGGF